MWINYEAIGDPADQVYFKIYNSDLTVRKQDTMLPKTRSDWALLTRCVEIGSGSIIFVWDNIVDGVYLIESATFDLQNNVLSSAIQLEIEERELQQIIDGGIFYQPGKNELAVFWTIKIK